ncbi:MAG: NAD(+)/NADH kinase [Bacteroidales bacterium]|nr:NAD(+)/NADH kinase [Bacteroidales bacterium]
MKIAVILGNVSLETNPDFIRLKNGLESAGYSLFPHTAEYALPDGTDMVLGAGGDGTYLRAARLAARAGVPVLGVNFGRLGFLSENTVDTTLEAFAKGDLKTKERVLLRAKAGEGEYIALNEVVARRTGPAMLGVRVSVNGRELPVYWGDGLMVATSAGSTGYNLSVGGPIVLPSSKVFIIAPIAPHNLNVRPLVVPNDCRIEMEFVSRDENVSISVDNQNFMLDRKEKVEVSMAQFSLKRLCLGDSSFIQALSDKLFWGEDRRNER